MDHGICIHAGGRAEDDTCQSGLRTGFIVSINIALRACHFRKHAIDYPDVRVHMLIRAGAEAVDEGDCADVQSCLVRVLSTWAEVELEFGTGVLVLQFLKE